MLARPNGAANRQVEHIGPAAAEYNVPGIGSAEQLSNAAPSPFDNAVGLQRLAIAATAVRPADFTLVTVDRIVHRLRFGPTSGGVIEIDAIVWRHGSDYYMTTAW